VLRSQVAALPTGIPRVAFAETDWFRGGRTLPPGYDEFGFSSSVRPWVLEPWLYLILHEEGRLEPRGPRPTVDIYPWYDTLPQDEPALDLRGFQ
jgi:hypothetical protein